MDNSVSKYYDNLINNNNDPFRDSPRLKEYMDKWDGEEFIERLNLSANKNVLEIGVGTGRLASRVAPLCKSFTGIDISPKTIERAKENLLDHSNIELILGDFLEYEVHKTYDVIYSSLTFMHIKDKLSAIKKVASLLNKNSRFVLSVDKSQETYIEVYGEKLEIHPDTVTSIMGYVYPSGLFIEEILETEFAHIFVCVNEELK